MEHLGYCIYKISPKGYLGGGFKDFLFSPLPGEMIQFDLRIFFKWVVQPPTTVDMKRLDCLVVSIVTKCLQFFPNHGAKKTNLKGIQ